MRERMRERVRAGGGRTGLNGYGVMKIPQTHETCTCHCVEVAGACNLSNQP